MLYVLSYGHVNCKGAIQPRVVSELYYRDSNHYTINSHVCRFAVRYYTDMYKCLYDLLKDSCNATASAIYTDYHVIATKRWLATKNCSVSE